jgi:hypothetical protein
LNVLLPRGVVLHEAAAGVSRPASDWNEQSKNPNLRGLTNGIIFRSQNQASSYPCAVLSLSVMLLPRWLLLRMENTKLLRDKAICLYKEDGLSRCQ